jgi:hypothetical protein
MLEIFGNGRETEKRTRQAAFYFALKSRSLNQFS